MPVFRVLTFDGTQKYGWKATNTMRKMRNKLTEKEYIFMITQI